MCTGQVCNYCDPAKTDVCKISCSVGKCTSKFCAKEFLDNLLNKGSHIACDESSDAFNNQSLPHYYNEEMYSKGQKFFYKHIFGMFLGNFLGLICGLAIKSSLAILILTNMSSSNLSAFKRYVATIFHMMIWYDSDFKPNSRLWRSLQEVKSKHNSASKKARNVLKYGINQKDMALTQFGFMGFAMVRREFLGIHDCSEEELRSYVHLWRVIGYALGIEDEFNICRESLEETKAICNEIIERVLKPAVNRKDKEHHEMCSYLINGLWAINPFLNLNSFMFYLGVTLDNSRQSMHNENVEYKKLTSSEKRRLRIIVFVTSMMRFTVVRIFLKYLQIHSLYMARTFPFLAYYTFGRENSKVRVIGEK